MDSSISRIEFTVATRTYVGTRAISNILIRSIDESHIGKEELPIPEYAGVFSLLRLYDKIFEKIRESAAPIEERELVNELASHSFYTYYNAAHHYTLDFKKHAGECTQCRKVHSFSIEHNEIVRKIENSILVNQAIFGRHNLQKEIDADTVTFSKEVQEELKKIGYRFN